MKELKYVVAAEKIDLLESKRGEDTEFIIRLKKQDVQDVMHEMRRYFESDDLYTDILFYTFKDHVQIIVKEDSYLTFILGLFKWQLLKNIEWVDGMKGGR